MVIRDPGDHPSDRIIEAFFQEKVFLDLKAIICWLVITMACIYIPVVNASPIRIVFALPLVLFIPGYSLIAALFPDKSDIDDIERIALSFGLSIAVVPLIGLGLNYTPWGIRLDPIAISLVIFTIAMVLIAQLRRVAVPADQRYVLPVDDIIRGFREEFFPASESKIDKILSVILFIAIIAAIGTTVYVIVVPKEGEKFSEFYILGEKKMAADYPSKMYTGDQYPMYIGVGNHEYRNVTYTIETYLLNMVFDENTNTSSISDMNLLNRSGIILPHNETAIIPYNLTASSSGANRVEFLLFNESVPGEEIKDQDRINASYRDLHLWVKIQSGK